MVNTYKQMRNINNMIHKFKFDGSSFKTHLIENNWKEEIMKKN